MRGSALCLVSLLVPVRCWHAQVAPDIRIAAPVRPFILHGCLAHAAVATWLGQPCSKPSPRVVLRGGSASRTQDDELTTARRTSRLRAGGAAQGPAQGGE